MAWIKKTEVRGADGSGDDTKWVEIPSGVVQLLRGEKHPSLEFPSGTIETGDDVRLELALYPSAMEGQGDGFPEDLLNLCAGTVVPMAAAWLAGQPGRPWMDMDAKMLLEREAGDARRQLLRNLNLGGADRPDRVAVAGIIDG